ncbi:MAG: hypothetical protein H6716_20455 [Polyangiaceae bacterium]|nr:hypothetical protein [Polyangiaceae bacterium]
MIDQVTKAAQLLASDKRWREMLVENAYWASYEGFLQSSLLWAFNKVSTDFTVDRERQLLADGGRVQPDLVVMRRADEQEWWTGRKRRGTAGIQPLVQGAIMLKVAWDAKHSKSGAAPRAKAQAVLDDEAKLRRIQGEMTRIVGVVVGAWSDERSSLGAVLAEAEQVVLAGWVTRGIPLLGTSQACRGKHCSMSFHLREVS